MIIAGAWLPCADEFVRPLVKGFIVDAQGNPFEIVFQLDIGADRTLLTRDVFNRLGLPPIGSRDSLSGLGGSQAVVQIESRIGFRTTTEHTLVYRGQYYCLTDADTLTLPLLGRDLLDIFAVIVDRPGDRVALLTDDHAYTVEP